MCAAPAKKKRCVHCRKRTRARPRGLCFRCYARPEVKAKYPPGHAAGKNAKFAARAEPDGYAARPLPPRQTYHRPGTEGKMRVMRERLLAGCRLHHPLDARDAADPRDTRPFAGEERFHGGGDDPLVA